MEFFFCHLSCLIVPLPDHSISYSIQDTISSFSSHLKILISFWIDCHSDTTLFKMSIQNAFAGSRRLKLDQLMTSLQCPLCSGYLIDAVTIVECSHSFCRSCIVLYVQQSLDNCQCTVGNQKCNCCRCPLPDCTNALSRVNPFKGVHPDPIRQEIVYKLVPNLYQSKFCSEWFLMNDCMAIWGSNWFNFIGFVIID